MTCCEHLLLPEAATECSVGASVEHLVGVAGERSRGVTAVLVVVQVAVSLLDSHVSELEWAVAEPDVASLETSFAVYQLLVVEHAPSTAGLQAASRFGGTELALVTLETDFAEEFVLSVG